jgi:MFS family permease
MALACALLADGPASAALPYGLTALSIGGNYTPGLILIAERFPVATRGRATGFFLAATSIGYASSLFLTGAVLSRFGWRTALLVGSLAPSWARPRRCGACGACGRGSIPVVPVRGSRRSSCAIRPPSS